MDLFRHELDTVGLMCAGRAKFVFSCFLIEIEKFNCRWLRFFHASELGVSFSTLLTVDLFRHELDTIGLMCAGRG